MYLILLLLLFKQTTKKTQTPNLTTNTPYYVNTPPQTELQSTFTVTGVTTNYLDDNGCLKQAFSYNKETNKCEIKIIFNTLPEITCIKNEKVSDTQSYTCSYKASPSVKIE